MAGCSPCSPPLATFRPVPVGSTRSSGTACGCSPTSATAALDLRSRSGRDVTANFPELAGLVELAPDVLLDGEVVLLEHGVPSFHALADRMQTPRRRRRRGPSPTWCSTCCGSTACRCSPGRSPSGAPRWSASSSRPCRTSRSPRPTPTAPRCSRPPRSAGWRASWPSAATASTGRAPAAPAGSRPPTAACRRAWSGGWRPENVGTARVSATRVGALLLGVPTRRRAAVRRAGRVRAGVRGRAAGPARAARRRRPLAVHRARPPSG